MTDKTCRICFGIGWVCENHPDRPEDKEPCELNDRDPPNISHVV
jgi:hypothetical protein